MKRRGPKSLLTPKLQKQFCDGVADGNTFKTMCGACGIGERTFYDWMERHPAFAAAVYRARAKAKAKLLRVIVKQAPRDWRAAAFILERSWPDEYSRVSVERVEQIGEKADEDSSVKIYYQLGNKSLAQLLDFPIYGHDSPKVAREKQRRLLGQEAKAPAQETISDASAPEEKSQTHLPPA